MSEALGYLLKTSLIYNYPISITKQNTYIG